MVGTLVPGGLVGGIAGALAGKPVIGGSVGALAPGGMAGAVALRGLVG
jgi:hypothetical protein